MLKTEEMKSNHIRELYSRNHDTVFPKLGVFLGGPTPPSGEMKSGWRRKIVKRLKEKSTLNASMIVVSPEPETGDWAEIDHPSPTTELERVRDKQMPWELQY